MVVSWMLPVFQIYNSLLKLCGNRKDNVSVQIQDQKSHLTKKTFQTKPENNSPKKKEFLEKRARSDHLERNP